MSEATATVPRKRHRNYPEDAATPAAVESAPEAAPEVAPEKPKRVRPERAGKAAKAPAKGAEKAAEAPTKPKATVTKVEGSPVAVVKVEGEEGARYVFELEAAGETKGYRKFTPPKSSGCVGTLYVPHAVGRVRISLEAGE